MFRTVPLSIIRSFSLYTQQWYMSYRSADSLRAGSCSQAVRSPTSLQGTALFSGLWDLSRPWESLDRIHEEELGIGWTTNIEYGGEVLVTPKDRLQN